MVPSAFFLPAAANSSTVMSCGSASAISGQLTDPDPAHFRHSTDKIVHLNELRRILFNLHTLLADWEQDTIRNPRKVFDTNNSE